MINLQQTLGFCHLNFEGNIEISEVLFYKSFTLILGFLLFTHTDDMAEAATHPYNLRLREEVVELPVQLQLSDDTRFMSDLMASDRTQTGQVSDTDSSIDESDCEALVYSPSTSGQSVNLSDNNLDLDQNVSHGESVNQQMINMQILHQLQSLGKRLDSMEEKTCKKTTDQTKVKNKTVKKKSKTLKPRSEWLLKTKNL